MCECGCISCGDFYQIPGPDNSIYVLQKYPGCKGCDSPMGLIIQQIYKSNNEYDDFKDCKKLKFWKDYTSEISFLSRKEIYDKLKKFLLDSMASRDKREEFDDIEADVWAEEFCDEIIS